VKEGLKSIMKEEQNIIIYNTADGKASVSLYAKDGSVWMNQNQLAALFDTSVPNISMHISNILKEEELSQNSVIKDYLTTAADGKKIDEIYSLFDKRRKEFEAIQADEEDLKELDEIEKKLLENKKGKGK
jgi:hypothetical protein